MADFNRVIMIGRLTRDPESRTFANGGKVVKFGFACSPSSKKDQAGEWQNEPMFIDVDVFNRGDKGTQADQAEKLKKGSLICLEGKLHLETWDDKTSGQKRSKHKIVADQVKPLDKGAAPSQSSGGGRSEASNGGESSGEEEDQIPF